MHLRASLAGITASLILIPTVAAADTNAPLIALYTQLIAALTHQLELLQAGQPAAAATATTGNVLEVTDPGQPAASLAPQSASVLFLTFALTAGDTDVRVSQIKITKTGLGDGGAFYDFGLYDDESGLEVGPNAGLASDHTLTFRYPFTIPAHTTMTLDLYANMQDDLSAYDAQMPAFSLVGIDASAPIEGQLPLHGTPQTINTTIVVGGATAYLSPYDPMSDTQRVISDTSVRFSGIRIAADAREDLKLTQIIWTQSGTAGQSDIANVQTVVNGTSYPTFISPYDARAYVTSFDPAIIIPKGQTIDLYVQGDLRPSGANRTVEFDIHDNNDDIALEGTTYGFPVGISAGGNTATSGHSVFLTDTGDTDGNALIPFFSGSVATINGAMINYIGK